MTPSFYRFYVYRVIGATKEYLSYNRINGVQVSSTFYELIDKPEEWSKQVIKLVKNSSTGGLFTSFSINNKVFLDSAKIFNWIIIKEESGWMMGIDYLTSDLSYTTLYSGLINTTNSKIEKHSTTIELTDNTLSALIKDKSNVKFDIPIDNDFVDLLINPADIPNHGVLGIGLDKLHITPSSSVNYYSLKTFVAVNDVDSRSDLIDDTLSFGDIAHITGNGKVNLKLRMKIAVPFKHGNVNAYTPISWDYYFRIESGSISNVVVKSFNLPLSTQVDDFTGGSVTDVLYLSFQKIELDISISCQSGDLIKFMIGCNPSSVFNIFGGSFFDAQIVDYDSVTISNLDVQYPCRFLPTTVKAITPLSLLSKVVNIISPNTNVYSGILSQTQVDEYGGIPAYNLITSGSIIRGLSGAKITTSLNDLMSHFYAMHGASIGEYNGNLMVETTDVFNNPIDAIDIGDIGDYEITKNKDDIFNSIISGFDKCSDFENDLWHNVEYSSKYDNSSSNKLNASSPFIASDIKIEYDRADNLQSENDSNYSEDIYVIESIPIQNGYRTRENTLTDSISAVYFDKSVYTISSNIRNSHITPRRNILRLLKFIPYSGLLKISSSNRIISGAGTYYQGGNIYWNEPNQILEYSDLYSDSNLYSVFSIEFNQLIDNDTFLIIKNSIGKTLSFSIDFNKYYAIINSIDKSLSIHSPCKIQCTFFKNNNLTQLI